MITPEEKESLEKVIGLYYTDDVLEILNNKGIRNRNGHPHTPEYVRAVYGGYRTNTDVEAAIWQLAKNKIAAAKKTEKLKREILN